MKLLIEYLTKLQEGMNVGGVVKRAIFKRKLSGAISSCMNIPMKERQKCRINAYIKHYDDISKTYEQDIIKCRADNKCVEARLKEVRKYNDKVLDLKRKLREIEDMER